MKAAAKRKWLAALRSGDYKQTCGVLKNRQGKYCCMGVLRDVAVSTPGSSPFNLVINQLKEVGLTRTQQNILTGMNDKDEASFKQIAKYIDKNL